MPRFHKLLALLLSVSMLFAMLSGCADNNTANTPADTATTEPAPAPAEPAPAPAEPAPAEPAPEDPAPEEPAEPALIAWGEEKSITQQAIDSSSMIICFMSGEGLQISGGSSESGFGETKWGDSALIAFPNGEVMLIDGGMPDYRHMLNDNLTALGVTKLDYVVLSHRHDDHWGGLLTLGGAIDTFEVGTIYSSGMFNGASSDPAALEGKARDLNINIEQLHRGDILEIGDVSIEVLWPAAELAGTYSVNTEDCNNGSLVMRFQYGDVSTLFTGDLYVSGEWDLINALKETGEVEKLDVDILKIPHHGRKTSSSGDFVDAVTPQVAVATGAIIMETGTYSRYAKSGARVLMDYFDGYVKIATDGTNIDIACSRVRDSETFDRIDNAFLKP